VIDTRRDQGGHEPPPVVVIGAGPAGLTAALCLVRRGERPVVLEADDTVGGISRTVQRDGWRFDIGGHRFFTKVAEVEAIWHDLLGEDDLLVRPRMSRIFYDGKFYDYPLKPANALRNLGLRRSIACVTSYAWARVHPPADTSTFEGWVSSRFGSKLYRTFFKTYTEKVWGVPAASMQADWAAQRIRNLSLGTAIKNALFPQRSGTEVTSLIEEFLYPRLGPGMMWEVCHDVVVAAGARTQLNAEVRMIERSADGATAVRTSDGKRTECRSLISSMPIGSLVEAMQPPAPANVLAAARGLRHRDFLTVALVVPESAGFPDNWIYVHSPDVRLGRVQNFGSWSPAMVKPGRTCLGLEYFVNRGDDLLNMDDHDLIEFATAELRQIGLLSADVETGFVVRVPKAYPAYDGEYAHNVDVIRQWLEAEVPNVFAVGRNGMHRYNNQDHSMLTAMLAVENIMDGSGHDLWAVNVDEEYHEQSSSAPQGTGRAAPVFS